MSKTDGDSSKRQQKQALRWALTIFLVTIAVSATISFVSGEVMDRSSMAVAFLILLFIVEQDKLVKGMTAGAVKG